MEKGKEHWNARPLKRLQTSASPLSTLQAPTLWRIKPFAGIDHHPNPIRPLSFRPACVRSSQSTALRSLSRFVLSRVALYLS
jgi:hypothetical protein